MPRATITKRAVDAAKPTERDTFIWDDEISGFGLKVTPTGRKVYVFQYRIARPGEAERTPAKRYTIGKHGKLTPEQARSRAKELAALVENGIDPRQRDLDEIAARDHAEKLAAEKSRLESDLSFEKVAAVWLDHYENEKDRRPSSLRLAKLVVNNHLKPLLAGKPIPHIGRADLQPIFDAIPARQRGMRRAVFAYASVLFGWAYRRGDIPENPLLSMVKPEVPRARDRVLSDDELRAVWKASETLGDPFGPYFRLLILTGQRRSEVAGMKWEELDRVARTWTIPSDRAKNRTPHIVPLGQSVVKELVRLAKIVHGDDVEKLDENWPKSGFVLTTTSRTPISGMTKAKKALDAAVAEAACGEELPSWRIHDLRRTLATGLQKLGVRFEVTEAVLNHVSGSKAGVAGIYQRHDWGPEKRTALEAWASHVASLVSQTTDENVVSIDAVKRPA